MCLYVSSYHQGHAWSDGIERGLRQQIDEHCDVVSFYMDTSRLPSDTDMKAAGLAAYELALKLKPNIIITSDNNAAQYLITPYLLNSETPVVFSALDQAIHEYGLPASNVTGIVKLAPLHTMLINTLTASRKPPDVSLTNRQKLPGEARIVYLGGYSSDDLKMLSRIETITSSFGDNIDSILVDDFEKWLSGFRIIQSYDLVILGNSASVNGFDPATAKQHAQTHTRALSVAYDDWMMDYSVLGYTRLAEEQGEWAALATIAILGGLPTSDIPIVTNRKFETWLNSSLVESSGLLIGPHIANRAKKHQ